MRGVRPSDGLKGTTMDMNWLNRIPQNKLDRFALEFVRWRGLAPHDYRGAPFLRPGDDGIKSHHPLPVWTALRCAWDNTRHWRPL